MSQTNLPERVFAPMAANPTIPFDDQDIRDDDGENSENGAGGAAVMTLAEGASPPAAETPPVACAVPPTGDVAIAGTIECSNCHSPMAKGQSFCKRCGFYPALNMCIEVDAQAEAQAEGAPEPAKSHLEVWKELIPPWGWTLIVGVAVLLVISLAARFLVPAGPPRAIWTYAQFIIGVIALIAAHIACYMFAIMVNDTLSFVDIILKPVVIWKATLDELPKTTKRVALGTWGLTAAIFAALVVGGVRYDEIIDWGKVPPKKKLKPTVTVPIDAPPDDKSMEESLEEFKEQAGVGGMTDEELAKLRGNRQKMVKCLIIGFTPNRESDFDSLVLAVEEGGKWRYAGVMREGVPVEVRSLLNQRMRTIRQTAPAVPCDVKAIWLVPKLMCTVWYEDWNADQRLKRPFFDKMQPDFVLKKQAPTP
jgi:hypothetical protein